jgi:hypothetical protein
MRAERSSPFHARGAGAAPVNRCMHGAVPMVPGRVAETAEHRSCQHSQHDGWTKSQSRVRMGRKGERQRNGTNDGNRPRAHDRSPACCRFSFSTVEFWKSSPLQRPK